MAANCSYFTIQLADSGLTNIKEVIRYNIDTQCYDNDVRLVWLNPLGGIDHYTFSAKKTEESRFRSGKFEKFIGDGFSVEDRGETVLNIQAWDHIEVFSRAESRATLSWLQEIGFSSQIWVDDGTNFVPYVLTSRKAKVLDTESELMTIGFKLKKANSRVTQKN